MSKPRVIKSGYLCAGCGAWLPFEKCGAYCKIQGKRARGKQKPAGRVRA